MAEDWDLHAVVRGCSTVTSSSVSSSSSSSSGFASCYFHPEGVSSSSSSSGFSIFRGEQGTQVLSLSAYPFEARSPIEELHELCRPFFSKPQPLSLQASSPLSSLSSYSSAPPKTLSPQEKQQQQRNNKQPHSVTTPRSKRRYKSSCLLCFDTPKREKKDLGLSCVVKIISLVENFAFVKVLDCGCGCGFVTLCKIVYKCD